MKKIKSIYVAGHGGLIGSAVLRRLRKEGCRNLILRTRKQLELTDARAVEFFFRRWRPEVVILAAGKVGGILENERMPADFIAENLAVELNVLTAARRFGVEKLIFFSSSCTYPKVCPQPMNEDSLLTGALEPTSQSYAMAKLAGVELCLAINRQDGETRFLPVIPNNVYGPMDNFEPASGHVLAALIERFHKARAGRKAQVELWGSGRPRREFIHSDDVADACWHILKLDAGKIRWPLNIGVGQDISIRELAELVKKAVSYQGVIRWDARKPDGTPAKLLDSGRLYATGWRPKVELEEGVRAVYEWYLSQN